MDAMEVKDVELIDEDPPPDETPADVPSYPPPVPPILGEVDPKDAQQTFGYTEPKVVFTEAAIPKPPFGPEGAAPDVEAVKAFFMKQRDDLTKRIESIENLLGFIDVAGDLAMRVAKIERFVGVK